MPEPTVGEQRELVGSYLAPYPEGLRAWVKGLVVEYEGGGYGPWVEFPWHQEYFEKVVGLLLGSQNRHLYGTKARKQGWSQLQVAESLWRVMWFPWRNDLFVTYHEDAAYKKDKSFQARMQALYYGLPEWQRSKCPVWDVKENRPQANGFGTEGQVAVAQLWADRDSPQMRGLPQPVSVVKIATASPNVGAAEDLTRAVLDEIERYESPESVWGSVEPSVRKSGGVIVVGGTLTDKSHPGSFLWERIEQVRRGDRGGDWMVIGYGSRPGDDPAWWEAQKQKAERTGDLVQFYRYYGRTLDEMMIGTGTGLASLEALVACHEGKRPLALPAALAEWVGV